MGQKKQDDGVPETRTKSYLANIVPLLYMRIKGESSGTGTLCCTLCAGLDFTSGNRSTRERPGKVVGGRMDGGQEGSWEKSSVRWHGVSHMRTPAPGALKEDTSALRGLWVDLVGQSKPRA